METERHGKQQTLLTSSLEHAWHDRDDFYVGGNMFVYYSELQQKQNDFRGPDVFVVLGTQRRERKSWVVWAENGRTPDLVIELLSPSTEEVDQGEKMRIYAQLLRVSFSYLFDPLTGVLEGYELDHRLRAYTPLDPLPGGDFPCPVLGLSLGVRQGRYRNIEAGWLRWLDAGGRPLPTDEEIAGEQTRLREESERCLAEQTKLREESERRRAEALVEIERLKASRG
jgi:Uma2 family endonuclease